MLEVRRSRDPPGGGLEVSLRHDGPEPDAEQHEGHAGTMTGTPQRDEPEPSGGQGADDAEAEVELGLPREDRRDVVLPHLVGDPRLQRPGCERVADAPHDVADDRGGEGRDDALDRETGPDEDEPDDDRHAAAPQVRDDPGRHLEEEARRLEHRADEHHLEGVETDDAVLEDEVEREARGEGERRDRRQHVEGGGRVRLAQRTPQEREHGPDARPQRRRRHLVCEPRPSHTLDKMLGRPSI